MGIARQIGQHGLRSAERALGVDDPVSSAERRQIGRERLRISESSVIAEELQGVVYGEQPLQKQPPERCFRDKSRPAR
jgi:hypothetical protein